MATRCLSGVNETRKPMKKMCPKKVINEIDDISEDLIDIDEENVFQESYNEINDEDLIGIDAEPNSQVSYGHKK